MRAGSNKANIPYLVLSCPRFCNYSTIPVADFRISWYPGSCLGESAK